MDCIEKLYPAYNALMESRKVAELVIGNNLKEQEITNIIEFQVGCLKMCGLLGDGGIHVAHNGDTLTFYAQHYVCKPWVLPIRYN